MPGTDGKIRAFQSALIEQSLARLKEHVDSDTGLLNHPGNPNFKPVRESLCYAGLLLVRAKASGFKPDHADVRSARSAIKLILERQNRNLHGASGGAFPLALSAERASRRSVLVNPRASGQLVAGMMDHQAQQLVGSLLAVLATNFRELLGMQTAQAAREGARLAARGGAAEAITSTHQKMLQAWLEIEHGDTFAGEEWMVALTGQSSDELANARFGHAQAFGKELWALALWQSSARLTDWSLQLGQETFTDLTDFLHPALGQLFGEGLLGRSLAGEDLQGGSSWINVWLTWMALGNEPLLPRDLANPLDASLFALPALARLAPPQQWRSRMDELQTGYAIHRTINTRRLSGWFEKDLHLEACAADEVAPGSEHVVAAYWPGAAGLASLSCQATLGHHAICDSRAVRLEGCGKCHVKISGLGPGMTRLIEDGWQMPGLQLTCRGYQISNAQRSSDGLTMTLRPVKDSGLLVFSPMS